MTTVGAFDDTAHPYLTLGRLNQLARQHGLGDQSVIIGGKDSVIQLSTIGELKPELVVAWETGFPRYWVRQELTL